MPKKPLYLVLPLAVGLALAGCSGSSSGSGDSSAAGSSSTQATKASSGEASSSTQAADAQSSTAAQADSSDAGSSSPAEESGAGNNAALSDAQLKKVVSSYFEGEEGVQILSGKTLRAQAGAAGALVEGMKISPEKCNSAQGIDIGAEMKKNNIALGVFTNPENPMQNITLTVMSAGDPAEAQSKFDQGVDSLDDCKKMDVEVMGIKTKMTMKEAKVKADAPSALALQTVTTVQEAKVPASTVLLLDDGLQVQIQFQGEESDAVTIQEMADAAQEVLDTLKSS